MLRALANWWDAVELWLTQLAFPFQVLLAMLVLLPACWALAGIVERVPDVVARLFRSRRRLRSR